VRGSPGGYAEGRSSMDVWPWEYALFGLSTGSLGGRNMPIAPNCVSAARPDLGKVRSRHHSVIMAIHVKVVLLSHSIRRSHLASRRLG
jgi:hypothetical protein